MGFLKNPSRFGAFGNTQNVIDLERDPRKGLPNRFGHNLKIVMGFLKNPSRFDLPNRFGKEKPVTILLAKSIWPDFFQHRDLPNGFGHNLKIVMGFLKNPSRFDLPNRFGKEKPVTILLAKSIWQGKTRHNSTCQMDLAITSGLASGFVLENRAYF